jgi:glutaryl-CoA dehydrogenase
MLDFVQLEADLDQEERMIRDTAREFVEEHVKPDIGDHFEAGTFPEELITEMGELGFYAPNLEGYGSPNVSETAYGLLMQELEAGDSGLRSMASVQGALVMYPIHAYGSEEQKEEWLPAMGQGDAIGCFGLTEPEHGSNPSGMTTYAERNDDGYVLNGAKTWITNSPIADVAVVWARDHSTEDDPVRGFLVETDRDGVSTNKITEKLSLRASITGEIGLNDVHVPEDRLGCCRCGTGLLRGGATVRDRSRTVRWPDRPVPASTAETCRNGDSDHPCAAACLPARGAQRARRDAATARLDVQAQQRQDGSRAVQDRP